MKFLQPNKDNIVATQMWDNIDTKLYIPIKKKVNYKLYVKLSEKIYSKLYRPVKSQL